MYEDDQSELPPLPQLPQPSTSSSSQSRKTLNEKRLKPFTDYKKRPPFKRSLAVNIRRTGPHERQMSAPVVLSSRHVNVESSDFNQSAQNEEKRKNMELREKRSRDSPKPKTKSKTSEKSRQKVSSPLAKSSLYERRRARALASMIDQNVQTEEDLSGVKVGSKVTFREDIVSHAGMTSTTQEPVRYTAANLDTAKKVVSSKPVLAQDDQAQPEDSAAKGAAQRTPVTPPVLIPLSMPSASGPQLMEPPNSMSFIPFTPIVTPQRAEYTSITDEIDTSCMMHSSPNGSPSTPNKSSFPSDIDEYTKRESPGKDAIKTEAKRLKFAEETENKHLEHILRHRMRQISLSESDSMSDLAKHVIQEIELDAENKEGDETLIIEAALQTSASLSDITTRGATSNDNKETSC